MDIKKCENGHFFDIDSYSVCPHCGANVGSGGKSKGKEKKQKKNNHIVVQQNTSITNSGGGTEGIYDIRKETTTESYGKIDNADQGIGNDISGFIKNDEFKDKQSELRKGNTIDYWDFDNISRGAIINEVKDENKKVQGPQVCEEQHYVEQVQSAREAVDRVSSVEEGKTLSFFNLRGSSNSNNEQNGQQSINKTEKESSQAVSNTSGVSEPPVGWLVCVKGPHIGQCFNINSGRNSIGRNSSNRIVISQDEYVSREKHAWVSYEPKKRKFNIQPGDGSGITYLNDEDVMAPQEIKKYDKIEVGSTVLLFIPLCGEEFSWEEYLG